MRTRALTRCYLLASCLLALTSLAPSAGGEDEQPPPLPNQTKAEKGLRETFQSADAVFTATVGAVQEAGLTTSVPPRAFGSVTFEGVKAVRGAAPGARGGTLTCGYKEGAATGLDLKAAGTVLVAVSGRAVVAVVPATGANLAMAEGAAPVEKR